jgi:BMFP domain-containing protein YqiC
MAEQSPFEDLRARIEEFLARTPAKDIEKNMRALASSFLTRLDLVTREEFDVQAEVLRKTRERLTELEAKVASLEHPGEPREGQ